MPTPSIISPFAIAEVQATGNDDNGGYFDPTLGGVDYTQGVNEKVIVFDGATIYGVNAPGGVGVISIFGYTVLAGDIGNTLHITGGSNFTKTWYTIQSVNTTANTWTLGTLLGEAQPTFGVGGTGMTGRAGGAFANVSQADSIASHTINGIFAPVYVKNGIYNVASINSFGNLGIMGYNTNRTMFNSDSPPIFIPTENGFTVCNMGRGIVGNIVIRNDNNCIGITGVTGSDTLWKVSVIGCETAFKNNGLLIYCDAVNSTKDAFLGSNSSGIGSNLFYGCSAINGGHFDSGFMGYAVNCLVNGDGGIPGSLGEPSGFNFFQTCINCTVYNLTASNAVGFRYTYNANINCVVDTVPTYGYISFPNDRPSCLINCAAYNCGTANHNKYSSVQIGNFINLTTHPFVSPGSDFTIIPELQNIPIPFPGLSSITYNDLGCIQHSDSVGSSPTVAQIATAFWEYINYFPLPGSISELLINNVDANIASRIATSTIPSNFSNLDINSNGEVILQSTGLNSIVDSGVTAREAIFYVAAGIVGEDSGLPSNSITVKGLDNSTTAAVITTDSNNNRLTVTLTPP